MATLNILSNNPLRMTVEFNEAEAHGIIVLEEGPYGLFIAIGGVHAPLILADLYPEPAQFIIYDGEYGDMIAKVLEDTDLNRVFVVVDDAADEPELREFCFEQG